MSNRIKIFTRGITIFSVSILLISLAVYFWLPGIHITPAYPYIVLFMYAFTLFVSRLLIRSKEKGLSKFANAFMLANFGKLVLYTAAIFIYAYLNREDAVPFILTFFVYYILFTAYEIIALLKN